ncbi:MAG: SCP2 sterol-binding domain-containing protein [bacterium]
MPTVREIFEKMPASFQEEAAAGLSAVILFDVTGDGGGRFCVVLEDGALRITESDHEAPTLTLTVSAQDYIDITEGKLNPQLAFMTGRFKAAGDLRLAMNMPKIFKQ